MNSERRSDERYPSFRTVELVDRDPDGTEHIFPIMLRDQSWPGMGGVFIGQLPPPPEGEYELRGSDQQPVRVRLTWIRKVADYVSILGLEVLGD